MIDFYYYTSPNGRKVLVALEELGLPYNIHWVDIARGEQHEPGFRAISPAGKIPAIIDRDGPDGEVRLFESAAILIYLADRTGRLLPLSGPERYRTLSWLSWQIGAQGPMLGQATHFFSHARNNGIDIPYAIERYQGEARHCYEVMERHLETAEWFGPEFSIADIALFPWTRTARGQGIDIGAYPRVAEWSARIAGRPSAQARPAEDSTRGKTAGRVYRNAESQRSLFGEAFLREKSRREETE